MSEAEILNLSTLVPKDSRFKKSLFDLLDKRPLYNIYIGLAFSFIDATINLISIPDNSFNDEKYFVPILVDISRTVFYLLLLLGCKIFPLFRGIAISLVPIVISISLTESLTFVNEYDTLYIR